MNPTPFVRTALIGLACVGMLVPQSVCSAGGARSAAAPASGIADIRLSKDRGLRGTLVDVQGHPVRQTEVILSQADSVLARARTDNQGAYQFVNVNNGMYELRAMQQTVPVRVWSDEIAPPAAQSLAVVTLPTSVVRGQSYPDDYYCDNGACAPAGCDAAACSEGCGGCHCCAGPITMLALGATATVGTIFSIVAVERLDDLEDEVRRLQSP
jgi:hypothetical protein